MRTTAVIVTTLALMNDLNVLGELFLGRTFPERRVSNAEVKECGLESINLYRAQHNCPPLASLPRAHPGMAPASEQLYELVVGRRLVHDGDALFREQVLNAVISPTERGGWKISKRKSKERIDAAVALAMTADRAVTLRSVKPLNRSITLY